MALFFPSAFFLGRELTDVKLTAGPGKLTLDIDLRVKVTVDSYWFGTARAYDKDKNLPILWQQGEFVASLSQCTYTGSGYATRSAEHYIDFYILGTLLRRGAEQ